jgi:DNA-binding transcriptional LysR family regulator
VSRLFQRLEQDLGAALFDRQTKPLALNHDGRVALEHGQRVLNATEAFSEALPAAAPSGVLRIGTAHVLAEVVAERPLDLLRSRFSDPTLQIAINWAGPLLERLRNGDLDAAVISLLGNGEPKTELPSRRLGKEDVRIIGAASLASARRRSFAAGDELDWLGHPAGRLWLSHRLDAST